MLGSADETVGVSFREDLLQKARDKTLEVIMTVASHVAPGMTEAEAKALIHDTQVRLGAEKSWHPPQIRFGENTLLPFGKPGHAELRLKENDIFFFDIGPVFEGHEGDVGRPFVVGHDPEMERCRQDAGEIWNEVRDHWRVNRVSGERLYRFAETTAARRGWVLALEKANGHRIADFPHAARSRGSIEGFANIPAPNRWILEIQIRHPVRPFGAFYEDLLN